MRSSKQYLCWVTFAMMTGIATNATAAPKPPGVPAIGQCSQTLTAVVVNDLSFGDFDGTLAGSVVIDINGNLVSAPPPDHAGGIITAVTYDVSNTRSGCDYYPVEIRNIPVSIILSGPGAAMTAGNLITSIDPATQFTLSATPGQATRITIGATLTTNAAQAAGIYTTAFTVDFRHRNP